MPKPLLDNEIRAGMEGCRWEIGNMESYWSGLKLTIQNQAMTI
jgi:hypothetical protein